MAWTRHKTVKLYLAAIAIVYALLYPWFFCNAAPHLYLFYTPEISLPLRLSYIVYLFLVPISMPITIYIIWSNYLKHRYQRAILLSTFPILLYLLASAALKISEAVFGT